VNYGDLIKASKAYTDRYDQDLDDAIPAFTKIVESKINTAMKTGEQSVRAQIRLEAEQEYYSLPSDFGGFRDVELVKKGSGSIDHHNALSPIGGKTLVYLSPEEMNKVARAGHQENMHYTVVANQIQIAPPQADDILEVVYYQLVPPLANPEDSNWLSDKHPDAYIFGLCAEISAFAKDDVGFQGYDARFKESIASITMDDQITRWSGPSLRTQVDGLTV
jgi:hypothetical protein